MSQSLYLPLKERNTCPVCGLWYNNQLQTCSNYECEAHHAYDRVPPVIRKVAVKANAKKILPHSGSNQFTIFLNEGVEGSYIGGLSETRYAIDQVVPTSGAIGVVVRVTK